METNGLVVVGVDCSEASIKALKYALEQARARSSLLRVVTAYEVPSYWALPAGPPTTVTEQEIVDDVLSATESVVKQVVGGEQAPKVEVVAVTGPAAKVLVEAAQNADLLVVGHRGRGGFGSMLLGSVGLQCVLHAPCTVTVVR